MTEENSTEFEKQRLEIEKMKLELELKKLEIEKEKSSPKSDSILPKDIKEANWVAIGLGVITILTLFLPWVKGVSSSSVSIFGYNSSSNASSAALSGIYTTEGQLCLILSIVGLFLNLKGKRIASFLGIASVFLILVFMGRMKGMYSTVRGDGYSGSFEMRLCSEMLFSIAAYSVYSILSYWNVLQSKISRNFIIALFAATIFIFCYYSRWPFEYMVIISIISFIPFKIFKFPFTLKFLITLILLMTIKEVWSPFSDNNMNVYYLIEVFGAVFLVELASKIIQKPVFETRKGIIFQYVFLPVLILLLVVTQPFFDSQNQYMVGKAISNYGFYTLIVLSVIFVVSAFKNHPGIENPAPSTINID